MTATVVAYIPPDPTAVDEIAPAGRCRLRGHMPVPGDVLVDANGQSHLVQAVTDAPSVRSDRRRGIRRVLAQCDTTTLAVRVDRQAPLVLAVA